MIGRSDDDALLDRLVKRIEGNENIEYLEELDMDDANSILERSSVLVNTSMFEGFSNTFIQAWLRRTPVLSLNSDPDELSVAYAVYDTVRSLCQALLPDAFTLELEQARLQWRACWEFIGARGDFARSLGEWETRHNATPLLPGHSSPKSPAPSP